MTLQVVDRKEHTEMKNIDTENIESFLNNETDGFMATVLEPKDTGLSAYVICNCYGSDFAKNALIPIKHESMIIEIAKDTRTDRKAKSLFP